MGVEQLKPEELDTHVENGTFRLAFIGMSNAGKSYRSRVLHTEEDFLWYHVDKMIQEKLGFSDIGATASWLGMPTSETYPKREREYLELENEFTRHASMSTNGKNLVFDTTGSVAHLPEDTVNILRDNCLVVHLDVGENSLEEMMARFRKDPKPVAWCGYFTAQEGETDNEAFERCYPKLLKDRLSSYRTIAHVNVPASALRDTSGDETINIIKTHLSA